MSAIRSALQRAEYLMCTAIICSKLDASELNTQIMALASVRDIEQVILIAPMENCDAINKKRYEKVIVLQPEYFNASYQRNVGLRHILDNKLKSVLLIDDDIEFQPEEINGFLNRYKNSSHIAVGPRIDIIGGPRPVTHNKLVTEILGGFGLYPMKEGMIAPSGWHKVAKSVDQRLSVEWLPTAFLFLPDASRLKHECYFSAFVNSYYLEDLEFSLRINSIGSLLYDGYFNVQTYARDKSDFGFGFSEIMNRYLIVKNDSRLNSKKFSVMVCFRIILNLKDSLMSCDRSVLLRLFGNFKAVFLIIFRNLKTVKRYGN